MFIIFGSPRSGTTLLATTLHQHDQVVIPDETDFIIPTAFLVDRIGDPAIGKQLIKGLITASKRFPYSIGQYLTADDVAAAVDRAPYSTCDILTSIYDAVASKSGKPIAGDKSPNDLLVLRVLVKTGLVESDIKIIHLVRDVRDVMLSLARTEWAPANLMPHFPRFWSASNLYLHHLLKGQPHRYHFLRYEELIDSPERHLSELCRLLGIPFQDGMLDHAKRSERHRGVENHRNLGQPFLKERIAAWKTAIDPALQTLCQTQAREALLEFGYLE